jgi:hypothetical protein
MVLTDMHDTSEAEGSISSCPNITSKVLQTDLAGSMDPFLSDEIAPPESSGHNAELEVDGVGARVKVEEGGAIGEVGGAPERKPTLDELPPNPPLTRPASHKNLQEAPNKTLLGTEEGEGEPVEVDLTEWHPLDHTQSESKDLNQTQDTTFVDDSVVHGSDEKHVPTLAPHNQTSNPNLRIVTKAPSPQPWDLVDPLPSNNGDATDYYSTLGTKNFGTLQKKR